MSNKSTAADSRSSSQSVATRESSANTRTLAAPPASSDWRDLLAGGLYRTGLLRTMQACSRHFEVDRSQGSLWPHWRRAATPKFVILCYHRVGTGGVPLYSELPRNVFEAQMSFLRKRYRVVSLEEVCHGLRNGASEPAVAVTFDDGYEGVFSEAFPILSKYRIPATVFLTVDSIETGRVAWYDRVFLILQVLPAGRLDLELDGPRHFDLTSPETRLHAAIEIMHVLRSLPDWRRKECFAALERRVTLDERQLAGRMLSWSQVKIMQQAGIKFGSHTITHPVVSRLMPKDMERELGESKRLLEAKLECPVLDFAFPFGQLDDCGLEVSSPVLSRCGYRSASTTIPGPNTSSANPMALYRVQIGDERNLAMFAFRLNQFFLFTHRLAAPARTAQGISDSPRKTQKRSVVEGMRHA